MSGDHPRHVDPERLHQQRVLGGRARYEPSRVRSMTNQVRAQSNTDTSDDPRPVIGEEHEAQVPPSAELRRDVVRLAGDPEVVPGDTLDDQCQAEGQQQAVERIETGDALDHRPLDERSEEAHHDGAR